jgi:type I restriction enzyme, S subunit
MRPAWTFVIRYLVQFLRTKPEHLEREARGATIKGVSREVVTSLQIPLPSLEEQRRIADILDRADALRAKRREAIAKLETPHPVHLPRHVRRPR